MKDILLDRLRDLIQEDVGGRGLRKDPDHNLVNACPHDFHRACRSLAECPRPVLAVVTGFFIPTATPPAAETDGPLGALFLARALMPMGIPVVLVTDDSCAAALRTGLDMCGMCELVPVVTLPAANEAQAMSETDYWEYFAKCTGGAALTHLLAIERVGPNLEGRCHTMRGRDISDLMSPAHLLFDHANRAGRITTLGIGDGGNEIGMGKIPREIIERNIPRGGLIACRTPAHHLIVCGVSNWGAYALAAGLGVLRDQPNDPALFDAAVERKLLEIMVEKGPLVDGVLGKPSATVDGLTWEQYADVLVKIGAMM